VSITGVTRAESRRRAAVREGGAIRRARERGAGGPPITKATRDMVWERDGGCCYLCKLPVPREQLSIEHVIALANGGTNHPDNLRAACRGCNSRKGARTVARRKGLRRSPLKAKPRVRPLPDDVF